MENQANDCSGRLPVLADDEPDEHFGDQVDSEKESLRPASEFIVESELASAILRLNQ